MSTHINIIFHEEPKHFDPRNLHPCSLGQHRWAWLTDGRQACGYCGVMR